MSAKRLREVSVVLGLVLMVFLGGIVVVSVSRPAGLRSSPSPSRPATVGSPTNLGASPTASATFSATASATAADSPTPPGPTESDLPPPTASASPVDTTPAAPQREIIFTQLGIDTAGNPDEPPQPRYFTFVADGPGRVEATIRNVTFGRVRLCVWQGQPGGETGTDCQTLAGGTVRRDLTTAGPSTWAVSVVGAQAGASPTAQLRLRWPTNDARLHIEGFRFQGEAIENYNGFTARIAPAADGGLSVAAGFDDGLGGAYPWRLQIDTQESPFLEEGEGTSMSSGRTVLAGSVYRVTLWNRQTVADQRVLLRADLDWP